MPYIFPSGHEISKISLYTSNPMCTHLDRLRAEMNKFIEAVTLRNSKSVEEYMNEN